MNILCNDPAVPTAMNLPIATLCVNGMFGYRLIHVRDLQIEIVKYAQYDHAVRVTYIEKGKRKRVGFMETYQPSLVVLQGHTTIALKPDMEDLGGGCSRTRHASVDPAWRDEFNAALEASDAVVLRDFRDYNPHTGEAGEAAVKACDAARKARIDAAPVLIDPGFA